MKHAKEGGENFIKKSDHVDQKKMKQFLNSKAETLNRKDLSLKGSIDEPIRPLVDVINAKQFYYTTSTCSGRITLIEKPLGKSGIKKGNNFLFSSHDRVECAQLIDVINSFIEASETSDDHVDKCLWLKFEPFIMHIQCFNLTKAQILLNMALASGCRNSGLTLGKGDKFMIAVRLTSSMEVPVHCGQRFNVAMNYIEFLCDESNQRLSDNFEKLSKLQKSIELMD